MRKEFLDNSADYWDNDDYDVRLGDASGQVIGRIFRQPRAPMEQPWFLDDNRAGATALGVNHGYAASREQAMRYFGARYSGPSN